MTHSPAHNSQEAARLIQTYGFLGFIRNVVYGGILYTLGLETNEGISTAADLIFAPLRALGQGTIRLITGTFDNLLLVVDAGTAATVQSFADGTAALLGPFAQPLAVGVAMTSLFVFITMANRLEFSPLTFIRGLRG